MARKKKVMGWTLASVSRSALEDRKLEVADDMFKGRWKTYTGYERCNTFYKEPPGRMSVVPCHGLCLCLCVCVCVHADLWEY
jgi:hypothetical protein